MEITAGIFAVLNQANAIVGTGFLVSEHLGVTCAHVIAAADAIEGDTLQVQFAGQTAKINARILPEFWREIIHGDLAFLQLESVPEGAIPLRLASATDCRAGNPFYSFGYATAADVQGIIARGTIDGYLPEHKLLQLQAAQANRGMSGAPVLDEKRGVIVGMITKGHTELGRNGLTTFATPTETIWQVCPQLKPPTPILPRHNPIVEGINLLPYDYDQRIQNFLTEYLGTDAHPVPFGGRDEALHMLDTWLADTTPYLLLAAPAGRGKSALLVRWLDSLKAREDLALTFMPVSIRFGTNMERVFYAALAARLAFLHGDDVPASPETSTAVYRGLVSDYLSKPLANGRTLLVVLDGLDEAADWRIKADFMPVELPAGVRVIVSARFLAGDANSTPWLRRLNWERSGLASAPSLTPLDRAGVADVLLKMGCPLDELSRNVDIVAELYRLSEGDPLLVGLYVGDLWTKGEEVTRLKPEDLAGIRPGYKGYFDRWWDDQKKLWGRQKPWLEQHVRTVRSLLAGALGPLFIEDLKALAPELETDYVVDALDVLKRFVIGDNQVQGYVFSHPKLGYYFWETLTETEQMQWEKRFLDWGEHTLQEFINGSRDATKKKEALYYVVSNYAAHLERAEQPIEKWLPLIHHQQWAQAWFTVEGAYGGYSQDVQRVWNQSKVFDYLAINNNDKAPYLGQQIRCALIEASLHSLVSNIPVELIPILVHAGLWTLPQTGVYLRQMTESEQQSLAIRTLIPSLSDEQVPETSSLVRALQDEEARAIGLSFLVQRLPELIGEAMAAAQAIQNEEPRMNVLSELAQRLPVEELGTILTAARAMQDEKFRACLLSALASRLPGVASEALVTARAIHNERSRARVLRTLAQHLPEFFLWQVLAAAQVIEDEVFRAPVLRELAQRLPVEELGTILTTARAMQHDEQRASVLSALVQRLPDLTGEALTAAQLIQISMGQARVLSSLAQYVPEGKLGDVLAMAQTIQAEGSRANVLSVLVQRLPERELGLLLEHARAMKGNWSRTKVLSALAQRLPDLAGEALDATRVIEDEKSRVGLLSVLAQRLPNVAGEALAVAQAVKFEYFRAEVLSTVAQYVPKEKLEDVLAVARAIQDEGSRASVLGVLAQRLPNVADEALETVRSIDDEKYRAIILSDLAQRIPSLAGEALVAAQEIRDEWSRASLLSVSVQCLSEEGLRQMLTAAWDIQDEDGRAHVLSALAQYLPEGKLDDVLAALRAMQGEGFRAQVLSALVPRLPEEELEDVLATARAMQDEEFRARVLSALVTRRPKVTKEALHAAWAIKHERVRAGALNKLAHSMIGLLPEDIYFLLETSLVELSHRTRENLFSDIAALMPVIIHIGTEDTPREIYEAIHDITTWWP